MIFSQHIKSEYPFVVRFFEAALTNDLQTGINRFAHAFLLCGANIKDQYEIALSIAKYLNSKPSKNPGWVENNAHPAVLTVSPIDYVEKSHSVITVGQIRKLRNFLGMTSNYHRVIIFTNAKSIKSDLNFAPPKLADQKERDWTPFALNSKVFSSSPANALLKILEEPPSNTTYFFLAKHKEDMLSTIVSRCQVLPVVSSSRESFKELEIDFMRDFPPKNEKKALELAQLFLEASKENGVTELIDAMQIQIRNQIVNKGEDRIFIRKAMLILQKFEDAKVRINNFVSEQNVVESLFLSLI